jgi:hypothetical protein
VKLERKDCGIFSHPRKSAPLFVSGPRPNWYSPANSVGKKVGSFTKSDVLVYIQMSSQQRMNALTLACRVRVGTLTLYEGPKKM